MTPDHHKHGLSWTQDVVPVSDRFDDPYYSLQDGLAECRHVFLDGNDLPARFGPGFHIGELGFGTGLNMLAALLAWRAAGAHKAHGALHYTGFEAFPMPGAAMARALSAFDDVRAIADPLIAAWTPTPASTEIRITLPDLRARVILGDARQTLPAWDGRADAWFLDGFAPAKNPELWQDDLMAAVAHHTAPGGSFATYSAAGTVRRALQAAGFDVTRRPGFGRKRHMSAGRLAP